MDILTTLIGCNNSRLMNGIMFDGHRIPIHKDSLSQHINDVKNGVGLKDYIHINEEDAILTRYTLKDKKYRITESKTIPLKTLNSLQIEYEILMGFDKNKLHCRNSSVNGMGQFTNV